MCCNKDGNKTKRDNLKWTDDQKAEYTTKCTEGNLVSEKACDCQFEIAEDLIKAGAIIEGEWSAESYDFNKSKGLMSDGKHFYGLGLDEENQSDLHDSRLEKWFEMLLPIFNINIEVIEGEK